MITLPSSCFAERAVFFARPGPHLSRRKSSSDGAWAKVENSGFHQLAETAGCHAPRERRLQGLFVRFVNLSKLPSRRWQAWMAYCRLRETDPDPLAIALVNMA
jgi:hypothetical protein